MPLQVASFAAGAPGGHGRGLWVSGPAGPSGAERPGAAGGPSCGGTAGCCSPQDAADARRVAALLGVDLFVLDAAADFDRIIAGYRDVVARLHAAGVEVHGATLA